MELVISGMVLSLILRAKLSFEILKYTFNYHWIIYFKKRFPKASKISYDETFCWEWYQYKLFLILMHITPMIFCAETILSEVFAITIFFGADAAGRDFSDHLMEYFKRLVFSEMLIFDL